MIIVVDDDPGILEAIERLLVAHGFDVEAFASGDALQARGRLEDARCLILDVNIPGGSGIELHRRLANAGKSVPSYTSRAMTARSFARRPWLPAAWHICPSLLGLRH
jgi:FixJ family two-component response regulator